MKKLVIIIPTLNEEKNVIGLTKKILKISKSFHILFIDDGSTDRTQEIIKTLNKENKNIKYIFRKNKSGIGSAHKAAIKECYKNRYNLILTMDADGTHKPIMIPTMLKAMKNLNADIVNTSRFVKKNSLKDWPISRKIMTYTRHYLLKFIFNLNYDASGAFRLYNLKTIKLSTFLMAKNDRYAFFWESLYILKKKKHKIVEISIDLPFRKNGSSKMKFSDIWFSLIYLFIVKARNY